VGTLQRKSTISLFEEEESDEEEDIILTQQDAKSKEKEVKGGTLTKLIERLSYHKHVDTNYLFTFLMTYRSFTTPHAFLEALILRYNITEENEKPEKFVPDRFAAKKKIIQLRVNNVIKTWVDKYFSDFEQDPELLKKLLDFVNGPLTTDYEKVAQNLKKMLSGEVCTIRRDSIAKL
jgi:son of sevenless-like protein